MSVIDDLIQRLTKGAPWPAALIDPAAFVAQTNPPYPLLVSAGLHAAPAASTDYFFSHAQLPPATVATARRHYFPRAGTPAGVQVIVACGTPATSNESGSLNLRINNTDDYLIDNLVKWGAGGFYVASKAFLSGTVPPVSILDFYEIKVSMAAFSLLPPANVGYWGSIWFEEL